MLMTSNGTGGINTFRAKAFAGVDSRIVGGGPVEIYNESVAPFTRRTACWAFGVLGMSAFCADQRLTIISPDIFLCATHAKPSIGATCTFVTEDGNNTNITRTVLTPLIDLGTASDSSGGDITVGKLSSALPVTVRPLRLIVPNLVQFLPPPIEDAGAAWNIPMLESVGENQATLNNWNWVYPFDGQFKNFLFMLPPTTTPRSTYYRNKGGDDSGHGCGVIIDGELIMTIFLSSIGGGGTGWGSWFYLSAIDAAIATLGGQPRASTFDPATLN